MTPTTTTTRTTPTTATMSVMNTPAAKAKQMKPEAETQIILDGAIRLTTSMSPLRNPSISSAATATGERHRRRDPLDAPQCLLARSFDVFCRHDDE